MEHDYTKCDVCGIDLGPDKMHIVIDNGRLTRHVYCCRKHRYVGVDTLYGVQVQQRTDSEIESLSWAFKDGKLVKGWE
jgi:hypothetical protein